MNYFRVIVAIHSLVAMSALAAPASIKGIVDVLHGDSPGDSFMGFVADTHGHVVAPVGRDATKLIVRSSDGTEYGADPIHFDPSSGLTLLKTSSPAGVLVPYIFAKDVAETERKVYGAKKDDFSGETKFVSGSIAQITVPDNSSVKPSLIIHNALVGEQNHGSPLFNNCGEVAGVIVDSGRSSFFDFGGDDEKHAAAVPADWVLEKFSPSGLKAEISSEPCLSDTRQKQDLEEQKQRAQEEAQRAQEEAQRAQEEADKEKAARVAMEAKLQKTDDEIKREKDATEKMAQELQQARAAQDMVEEQLMHQAEEAQEEQARLNQAVADNQDALDVVVQDKKMLELKEAKRQEQIKFWASIIGAILALILLLAWLMYRRSATKTRLREESAKRKEEEAQEALAVQEAREEEINQLPNVLLSGEDANSRRFVLRVVRQSLAKGAIVGRSPSQSDHMLNHEEMSRQHFRLFARHGTIFIEDLRSTNGTEVNGIMLASGGEAALSEGAQVKIGNLKLVVHLEQS